VIKPKQPLLNWINAIRAVFTYDWLEMHPLKLAVWP